MTTYASALLAARDAAASQHYPQATLYLVATPIGNLADISLRALHVLQMVDTVACEDTRHTRSLLRAYGIERPMAQLLALHQHNEREATEQVVQRLQQGQRVAYVSDAGTPGISDPGARLVAALHAQGLPVVPIPGASSVTAAVSVAGLDISAGDSFVFAGFPPTRGAELAARIEMLRSEPRAVVLLEAPHRIETLAAALAALGDRRLTVARELTKQFEQICTLHAADFSAWLATDAHRSRGEFVLVLHPQPSPNTHDDAVRVLQLLLAELPLKTAVKLAVAITGAPRNTLYDAALGMRAASDDQTGGT